MRIGGDGEVDVEWKASRAGRYDVVVLKVKEGRYQRTETNEEGKMMTVR